MMGEARDNGEKQILDKAMKRFPQFFPSDYHSNYMLGLRWWQDRAKYTEIRAGNSRLRRIYSYPRQAYLSMGSAIHECD